MSGEWAALGDIRQRALDAARSAFDLEIAALVGFSQRLDAQIESAFPILYGCEGRIVVTGIGKSGLVGQKIAATLSSTGSPAFFIHSVEALHGDSGVVLPGDVMIAISNSGSTTEVCAFAEFAIGIGVPIIAVVGRADSLLARLSTAVVDVSVPREADPLNLAPTSSTTVTMVIGDVLASALMAARNFTATDFGIRHPGGALGARTASSSSAELGSL
ncbi:MAG TPA: SIS domain-containing protein [Candidatus Nanopelagicaceae bacterium]|nr:SIS domain-containing protein [Candidatus Nanopelagicaceae bacterium]